MKTRHEFGTELKVSRREIIKPVHKSIHIETGTSSHHKGFMSLIEQTVDKVQSLQFISSGCIQLGYGM